MMVYIFFDTNILEIPEKKDFSKFRFSTNYKRVKEVIDKYDLNESVICIIPCVVLHELLEHYKADYKAKIQSYSNNVDEINSALKGVIKQELVFAPLYTKREYYEYITQSMDEYIKEFSIQTCDYPDILKPIVERAIQKKHPFRVLKQNGKAYSDAGFKDVVVWESICNHRFDQDDMVILLSNDNDLDIKYLISEINSKFEIIRTVDQIEGRLLEVFRIDKEVFEYKKYIRSTYFHEQLNEYINAVLFNDVGYRYQYIDPDIENALVERATINENSSEYFDMFEGILVLVKVKLYYSKLDENKAMMLELDLELCMNEKEIVDVGFLCDSGLENGTEIDTVNIGEKNE